MKLFQSFFEMSSRIVDRVIIILTFFVKEISNRIKKEQIAD